MEYAQLTELTEATTLIAGYSCQIPVGYYNYTFGSYTYTYGCSLGYDPDTSSCCNWASDAANQVFWTTFWIILVFSVLCIGGIITCVVCCIKASNKSHHHQASKIAYNPAVTTTQYAAIPGQAVYGQPQYQQQPVQYQQQPGQYQQPGDNRTMSQPGANNSFGSQPAAELQQPQA